MVRRRMGSGKFLVEVRFASGGKTLVPRMKGGRVVRVPRTFRTKAAAMRVGASFVRKAKRAGQKATFTVTMLRERPTKGQRVFKTVEPSLASLAFKKLRRKRRK